MCLAVPAKVVEITEDKAKLDYGGIIREANVSLVSPKIGDYVIVHAGYAIQILDPEEAAETLKVWGEYFDLLDTMGEDQGDEGKKPGADNGSGPVDGIGNDPEKDSPIE
jgi:hydrogenase expression/formation protein HypC